MPPKSQQSSATDRTTRKQRRAAKKNLRRFNRRLLNQMRRVHGTAKQVTYRKVF